jgi:ketosteroid isomerase-like protein
MAHPNEELVRRGSDAFSSGDIGMLGQVLDQNVVYHVPGRSPLAGDYRGQEEVIGRFFARILELTGGTFQVELHDAVANDEHAVSLFTARGQRHGKTLDQRSTLVFHARDGKLVEAWLFVDDQYALDEFFS